MGKYAITNFNYMALNNILVELAAANINESEIKKGRFGNFPRSLSLSPTNHDLYVHLLHSEVQFKLPDSE